MTLLSSGQIAFSVPDIGELEEQAVLRVLRSRWLTTGEECEALEHELGARLGGAHVAAVSSCTAALEASLAYLDLPPGARVAVPDWTFVATASVPARLGLVPALVDVDPNTLNMSVDGLSTLLREDPAVAAVVPVHFAGVPVDARVRRLCAERDVPVVNDSAHALGAADTDGARAASGVLAECFSFYATKNLTCAEGGAVATRDPALHRFVRSYRLHGLEGDAWRRHRSDDVRTYGFSRPAAKANLPDLLAALARAQLSRFDDMQAQRAVLVACYLDALADLDGVRPLPSMLAAGSAHHLFVVVLDEVHDRQQVRATLARLGVATSVHFPPLHRYRWFAEHAVLPPDGLPVAEALADRVLSLPLHPTMSEPDVHLVRSALRTALAGA